MFLYKTLAKEGTAQIEILRSKFIGHAMPVADREEAEAYLQDIRQQYKDATHNVPAMVIGDKSQIQWASDDGEPQGTSGAPMVKLLVEEGLTNCIIVVTRYFGGTKLGTGGLVRAYTACAKAAIEDAGIREVEERLRVTVAYDYTFGDRLDKILAERGFAVEGKDYTDVITSRILARSEEREDLLSLLQEATKGSFRILGEEVFAG